MVRIYVFARTKEIIQNCYHVDNTFHDQINIDFDRTYIFFHSIHNLLSTANLIYLFLFDATHSSFLYLNIIVSVDISDSYRGI